LRSNGCAAAGSPDTRRLQHALGNLDGLVESGPPLDLLYGGAAGGKAILATTGGRDQSDAGPSKPVLVLSASA